MKHAAIHKLWFYFDRRFSSITTKETKGKKRQQKDITEHKKDNTNLFDLVSKDGPKLKWDGSFEQLKSLLETKLSLSGTWSSPQENEHEFEVDTPTISFNANKKTLVINGEGSEELKERLLPTENDQPGSSSG